MSAYTPETAAYNHTILAGDGWAHEIQAGQIFRIVDLEGNQAVDTLFYSLADTAERYSAADTITAQKNIYLTCLLYTSPSPRDGLLSRMPSSA